MLKREAVDRSLLRQEARRRNTGVVDFLMHMVKKISEEEGKPRTLLAVCPNSEAVIKAALRSAKRANAPIKFAATLNQVDTDGGYTGLTPQEFVELLKVEAESIDYRGLIIVAIDHGGPWVKDIQSIENWSLEQCMAWTKKSFEAAISAGYDLIHVDPTVDKTLPKGATIPIEWVIERTLELIQHAELYRRSNEFYPISYEVGTEEVHGGLADIKVFERFLVGLKEGLAKIGFGEVWPIFVVGKVGTDLHTTTFDPQLAKILSQKAQMYGSFIKGHYTDYVENPEEYPKALMGAANVGPELTEEEYEALRELVAIEEELFSQGAIPRRSRFLEVLASEVEESGRWKKWLQEGEEGKKLSELSPQRQAWLLKTGCRYVWAKPSVIKSRTILYRNLTQNGYQSEEIVLNRIERAIDKYFRAFNLLDLEGKIQEMLKKES
ncbi:MAG: class II D-tagatose-bisphosphate aldolase non-catalytic subunit [Candidatus Caldatribacteriaceae bacterium]